MSIPPLGQQNGVGGVFGTTFVGQVDCHGRDLMTNAWRAATHMIVKRSGDFGRTREAVGFFADKGDAEAAVAQLVAGDLQAQGQQPIVCYTVERHK